MILPWVQVKNLASKVLALCAKQLPKDWKSIYGYAPVMLETFVEKERFQGTCYKAAN
ncbi:MAG: Druantia anti-phage system protein DruA [Bacillota bacterium]